MKKHNGWVLKNRWGSLLIWSAGYRKIDVLDKVGRNLKALKNEGCEIVKVRLTEIKGKSIRIEK